MQAHQLEVHDLIETPGHVSPRLYSIEGIHLGAMGQESIVELVPVDQGTPTAHGKRQHMFVPLEMIEAGLSSSLFTLTHIE